MRVKSIYLRGKKALVYRKTNRLGGSRQLDIVGIFIFDYEYEIEYEYDFSNLVYVV